LKAFHPRLIELLEKGKLKSSLVHISLNNQALRDKGVGEMCTLMRGNGMVRILSLWGNGITDVGGATIASMLRHNASVVELNLGKNRIGDGGARALCAALRVNRTVKTIGLMWNQVGEDQVSWRPCLLVGRSVGLTLGWLVYQSIGRSNG
jgi:Ran GTPase-activating protein (RanGAP) involved in mRNA processing and transport